MRKSRGLHVAAGSLVIAVLASAGVLLATPGLRAQKPETGKLRFEVYEDAKKEFRWRLKSANDQIVAASSEGYKAKADAKKAVDTIKKELASDKAVFEVYEDAKKEFRWRLRAANGEILATSGEGYKAKADSEKGRDLVRKGVKDAEVEDK